MKRIFTGLILVSLILLHGCKTTSKSSEFTTQTASSVAQAREAMLKEINSWGMTGALGVQDRNKAISANFNWRQQGAKNYQLQLIGPMASGTLKITGTPGRVTLTTSKNETFSASSGEVLLEKQTGWYLPVANLYYWVRGLQVPGTPALKSYDQYHHIKQMQQQGWTINYQRYASIKGIDLPTKISLQNQQLKVKLVIRHWGR